MRVLPETMVALRSYKGRGKAVTWEEAMEIWVVRSSKYSEFFKKKMAKPVVSAEMEPVVTQPLPDEAKSTIIPLPSPIVPISELSTDNPELITELPELPVNNPETIVGNALSII